MRRNVASEHLTPGGLATESQKMLSGVTSGIEACPLYFQNSGLRYLGLCSLIFIFFVEDLRVKYAVQVEPEHTCSMQTFSYVLNCTSSYVRCPRESYLNCWSNTDAEPLELEHDLSKRE